MIGCQGVLDRDGRLSVELSLGRKIAIFALSFVTAVTILSVGKHLWRQCCLGGPNPSAHKYLMPGDYTTHLNPGRYAGFVFTTWNSKGVRSSESSKIDISITGPPGGYVRNPAKLENMVTGNNERYGRLDFYFRITRKGDYRIVANGPKRLVFVIVPTREIYETLLGGMQFNGEKGDFNFEN